MAGKGISGAGSAPGWRVFVAAAGGSCIANASWWMQPLMIHQLIDIEGLGGFHSGLALSIEMAAMAAVSILSARYLIGRRLMTLAVFGALLAVAGSALSIWSGSYGGLLAGRALAGAGAGLALMMMNATASLFADPDKAFARLAVVSIVYGMVTVGAVPALAGMGIAVNPFVMALVALAVVAPLVFSLPRHLTVRAGGSGDGAGDRTLGAGAQARIALLALIAFAIGCASGVMWAFYAVIGQDTGLPIHAVDAAISAAIMVAIVGAGAASFLGGRLGRTIPVGIGLTILVTAVIVLSNGPSEIAFRLGTMGNVGALYFLTPYLFGAAAAQDASGRGAVYVGGAFYLTGAVGPALGGFLAETIGMNVVGTAIVIIAIFAFLTMWWIGRSAPAPGVDLSHEGPVMALHRPE